QPFLSFDDAGRLAEHVRALPGAGRTNGQRLERVAGLDAGPAASEIALERSERAIGGFPDGHRPRPNEHLRHTERVDRDPYHPWRGKWRRARGVVGRVRGPKKRFATIRPRSSSRSGWSTIARGWPRSASA